jgi:hypothetical protein
MSKQLEQALISIKAMPYYKNESTRSGVVINGHEDAVAIKLIDAGFSEKLKTSYQGLSKGVMREWADSCDDTILAAIVKSMPNGTFIRQPGGSQGLPDILVKDFNGRLIGLECKSTGKKVSSPMWNDNVPKQAIIYIISSAKHDATTLFMGKDVIDETMYELFLQQEAEIEKIVQKYKKLTAPLDKYDRGWTQKSRKQHFQKGSSSMTNYFMHPNRVQCEKNALAYAKQ